MGRELFVRKAAKHAIMLRVLYADMAQLVAQLICNQWVAGSIPVVGTIETPGQLLQAADLLFTRSFFLSTLVLYLSSCLFTVVYRLDRCIGELARMKFDKENFRGFREGRTCKHGSSYAWHSGCAHGAAGWHDDRLCACVLHEKADEHSIPKGACWIRGRRDDRRIGLEPH